MLIIHHTLKVRGEKRRGVVRSDFIGPQYGNCFKLRVFFSGFLWCGVLIWLQ